MLPRAATCLATFLLRATLHEVELSSTFCNNFSNFQSPLHSVTPFQQLVSQCFARSANQDPYYCLLGPHRLQVAGKLHSVTPLLSCTKNCLV